MMRVSETKDEQHVTEQESVHLETKLVLEDSMVGWKLDSGASCHCTGNRDVLSNLRPVPNDVQIFCNAAGGVAKPSHEGNILHRNIQLNGVYYSEAWDREDHYLSIGQLTDAGYAIQISGSQFTIHLAYTFNHIVGHGFLDNEKMSYITRFFNGTVLDLTKVTSEECKEGEKYAIAKFFNGTVLDLSEVTSEGCNEGDGYTVAEGEFVLDSACPHHITSTDSIFVRKLNVKGLKYRAVGGGSIPISYEGDVIAKDLVLRNVYYSHATNYNLLSVPQLDSEEGYHFLYIGDYCYVKFQGSLVGKAAKDDGNKVYYVQYFRAKDRL